MKKLVLGALGLIVLTGFTWTTEGPHILHRCQLPDNKGSQICDVKGEGLGKVGDPVSAYDLRSYWLGTGTITAKKKGLTTVMFDERNEALRAGDRVHNNIEPELDYRHSFSGDVTFDGE